MLGTPKMHHSAAFLPRDPIGSHCSTRKYDTVMKRNSGSRKKKRKRRKGALMPSDSLGVGRKGAMPDPTTPLA